MVKFIDMSSSTWLENIEIKKYPPLAGDISTEVVVVGGGLAGTLSAYFLARAGRKVVLLEKKDIKNSTTAYTTAFITADLDTDLAGLVKMFGQEKTRAIWNSGMRAADVIEQIVKEEKIYCEFSRTSLFVYSNSEKETKFLRQEYETAQKLGLDTTFQENGLSGVKSLAFLEIANQAKFHPIKFLLGVREAARLAGAKIYDDTEVLDIGGRDLLTVTTNRGKILANWSVMTTYQPFKNPKELFARKGMYQSYVFEIEIPAGMIAPGLYLDSKNPYHYFRIDQVDTFGTQGTSGQNKKDRMIVGGEDHRKEIPGLKEKSFGALEKYVRGLLPNAPYEIKHRWSGGILESVDGLPFIGRFSKDKPNQLVATAFSGNGMHFSAIAGGIIRDIIIDRKNPDIEIYNASRKIKLRHLAKKGMDFTAELFGGAVKNFLFNRQK